MSTTSSACRAVEGDDSGGVLRRSAESDVLYKVNKRRLACVTVCCVRPAALSGGIGSQLQTAAEGQFPRKNSMPKYPSDRRCTSARAPAGRLRPWWAGYHGFIRTKRPYALAVTRVCSQASLTPCDRESCEVDSKLTLEATGRATTEKRSCLSWSSGTRVSMRVYISEPISTMIVPSAGFAGMAG